MIRRNYGLWGMSALLVVALFNPWFMKYDYGAGFPMVILAVGFVGLLVLFEWKTKRKVAVWETVLLSLFTLLVGLSFAFSSAKNLGFSEMLMFALMPMFYLILAHSDFQWWKKMLRVLVVLLVVAVFFGFFQYLLGEDLRMSGPFMNVWSQVNVWPNALAMFIVMLWPLILLLPKGRYEWTGVATLVGIVLAGLFLTFSRGALLVLGLQLGLMLIYFRPRMEWSRVRMVLLAGAVAVLISFSFTYLKASNGDIVEVGERITFNDPASVESRNERVDFWLKAGEMTLEKPLLGYGPFSFRQVYAGKQEVLLASADHPHNFFLKIGAEYGLVALLVFLGWGVVWLWSFKKFDALNRVDSDRVMLIGMGILGAVSHSMIDYNFNFVVSFVVFWFLLAVVRSIFRQSANDQESGLWSSERAWTPLLVCGALLVMVVAEGAVMLARDKVSDMGDVSKLQYPRGEFLKIAKLADAEGDFPLMKEAVDEHLKLNSVDSEGYYWLGRYYCADENEFFDVRLCLNNYERALELNPLNDLTYYADYLGVFVEKNIRGVSDDMVERSYDILMNYYDAVQMNVHFTGYTDNVEEAVRLGDILLELVVDDEKKNRILVGQDEMLEKAYSLRSGVR